MKKIIAIVIALALLPALAGCGSPVVEDGTPESGEPVGMANPWREIGEAEARTFCPRSFGVPAGTENAEWRVLGSAADPSGVPGALVELSFERDGNRFTAREQLTNDGGADLSGMYYAWTAEEESELRGRAGGSTPCRLYRHVGEDGCAELCLWYDAESGVSYSLGVTADDLDGFDLRAVAEALLATLPLSDAEQRLVLEENRALWAFEGGPYAPDWYYAFTDLDRNGLLEVIAASTQGSGIFTYAHFYEVLPDGSGVRNLYHADGELEGPDDWPEIVRESLPCYYDRAADRYYYVCENAIRDGAAHGMTQLAALSLKDGAAEWEYLAAKDVQRTESGEQTSWTDGAGEPISEQEYASAVERRFAGMEASELALDWIEVSGSPDA